MQTAKKKNETDPSAEMELVHAAKRGDLDAFDKLVQQNSSRILRIALHITRSREDAEEIAQEAFLRAFKHLKGFEEKARFSTWLTRIAVNIALVKVRGLRSDRTASIDEGAREGEFGPQQIVDWRPNPEQIYSRVELLNILRKAVESLPVAYSTVFWLRTEGFSIIETAEMLGITEPAVKTRLLRARLQVRQRLSLYFEGEETTGIAAGQIAGPVRSSRNGTATYQFIP